VRTAELPFLEMGSDSQPNPLAPPSFSPSSRCCIGDFSAFLGLPSFALLVMMNPTDTIVGPVRSIGSALQAAEV
jgi:hypothetical protein